MPAGLLTGITNNPLLMSHGSVFPPCGRERQNPPKNIDFYKQTLNFTPNKAAAEPEQKGTTPSTTLPAHSSQSHRQGHNPRDATLPTARLLFPTIPSFPGALCRPLRLGTPEGWRSQGTALSPPFPRSGRSGQRQRDQGDSSSRTIRCRHRSRTRQAAPAKGSSITQGQPRLPEEEEEDWGPGTATRPGTVRG